MKACFYLQMRLSVAFGSVNWSPKAIGNLLMEVLHHEKLFVRVGPLCQHDQHLVLAICLR